MLEPHKQTLLEMITNEEDLKRDNIPVLEYLGRASKGSDSVSLPGPVPLFEQARIVNWLYHMVQSILHSRKTEPETSDIARHQQSVGIQVLVVGTAVLAHAITIYISRTKVLPLQQAFELQLRGTPFKVIDVDHECLTLLERRIFDYGDEIWGIDAGDHQDDWDPYHGVRNASKRHKGPKTVCIEYS